MRRVILLAAVAALIATACSGDEATETFGTPAETDDSGPATNLADAIRSNAAANPDRRFDDATTECLILGLVDEFGEGGLAELGVTPDSPDLQNGAVFVTPDSARRAVDVGMECVDVAGSLVSYLPTDVSLLGDSIECVAEQLQTDTFRDLFAELTASGGEPADLLSYGGAQIPIGTLLLTCLSPEELLRVNELLP
ncbi:MAG: hypothetical protein QNJ89_08380 [Acidimicrobiia bacterium]|nr:hypothetical protein [Acidimicrobiia bacterium]